VTPPPLVHQGFIYMSLDDLVATLAPFTRAGLQRGDRVFAVISRAGCAALREELGDDARHVELHDTERWKPRPFDRLLAVRRMVDGLPPGATLRAIGEPVWNGSPAVQREWARYESVINVSLARASLRFVCLYDGARLADELLEHGRRTHSELLEGGAVCPCSSFVPPELYVPALGGDFDDTPAGALDVPFDGDQHAFRAKLATHASEEGLEPGRIDQLVLAANEVATNAVVHGERPLRAQVWTDAGEIVCEIADAGPGIADPFAGWRVPDPAIPGGWGLPMTRQLCDALEISSNGGGTRVRLHMALERDGQRPEQDSNLRPTP
jgi:anti-sigma regulatory factor (Ser/Thr protein kinase)